MAAHMTSFRKGGLTLKRTPCTRTPCHVSTVDNLRFRYARGTQLFWTWAFVEQIVVTTGSESKPDARGYAASAQIFSRPVRRGSGDFFRNLSSKRPPVLGGGGWFFDHGLSAIS